jgi:hypothetical protein
MFIATSAPRGRPSSIGAARTACALRGGLKRQVARAATDETQGAQAEP